MSQKTIEVLKDDIYSKPPKINTPPTKLMFLILTIIGVLNTLDLKDYGPGNKKGYR